jgi:hypothetical protein
MDVKGFEDNLYLRYVAGICKMLTNLPEHISQHIQSMNNLVRGKVLKVRKVEIKRAFNLLKLAIIYLLARNEYR